MDRVDALMVVWMQQVNGSVDRVQITLNYVGWMEI